MHYTQNSSQESQNAQNKAFVRPHALIPPHLVCKSRLVFVACQRVLYNLPVDFVAIYFVSHDF